MGNWFLSVVFLVALAVNFLTLLPPALRGEGWKVLFKSPGFIIGDFFLIPLYVCLAATFLMSINFSILDYLDLMPYYFVGSLFLVSAIFYCFHPERKVGALVFLPHVLFSFIIIAFLFFSTAVAFKIRVFPLVLLSSYFCLALHVILSWIFPKRVDGLLGLVSLHMAH